MTNSSRWIAVLLVLFAILAVRPGLRGDTAHTEDIIKSIISGGGPGRDSISPESKPESLPESPSTPDEKLSPKRRTSPNPEKRLI